MELAVEEDGSEVAAVAAMAKEVRLDAHGAFMHRETSAPRWKSTQGNSSRWSTHSKHDKQWQGCAAHVAMMIVHVDREVSAFSEC